MPVSVPNPYTGKDDDTCSVSFAAQQAYAGGVSSPQTEAQYNRSKLAGEWGVIQAKAKKGEIPNGTKIIAFENKGGTGYVVMKNGKMSLVSFDLTGKRFESELIHPADVEYWIKSKTFKVSIPQAVAPRPKPEPVPADAAYLKLLTNHTSALSDGEILAVDQNGGYIVFNFEEDTFVLFEKVDFGHQETASFFSMEQATAKGGPWYKPENKDSTKPKMARAASPPKPVETTVPFEVGKFTKNKALAKIKVSPEDFITKSADGKTRVQFNGVYYELQEHTDVGWELTQTYASIVNLIDENPNDWRATDKNGNFLKTEGDPQVAAPVPSTPVNSGSTSVGSMSDEDVAAMFVKIKDDLAKEKGLNIKGANADLDALVHKTIGEKTGYTEAEVKGKIDAYKAAGNKLSALKKKVLLGTKKVPDPKPNAVPTKATATIVNDVKATVAEAVTAQPKKHYSDEDIAAAYIIAKDQIVAASGGKFTLYTKSDELDSSIALIVKVKTGFDAAQQKQAIANYLGSGKKLSTLKKQLAKQGAFTPQADTLKKSGSDKDLADKAKDVEAKADAGYTPTPTPSTAGPATGGKAPEKKDFSSTEQYLEAFGEWQANKGKTGSPTDTGKDAPVRVKKESIAERGDVADISPAQKTDIYSLFKSKGHKSYLTSSAGTNYDGFVDVQIALQADGKEYTLLQIMRVVDEQGAKKFGVENTSVFEKKVATFLTTPDGEQHIKDAEKAKAAKIAMAKEIAEALKLAKELEDNQPPLPADSSRFDILPAQGALDLNNRMQKEKAWTPAQITALKYYTSNAGYTAMNGANRRGTGSSATVKKIKEAQEGMRPSDMDVLLHRGCDLRQVGLQGNPEAIWGLTGKLLKDEGFMSTSYGGRAAFGGELQIEFQVPKGTMMTVVKSISHYSHENEILLAAGTQYRVLRVEKRQPHGWKLIVRVEGLDFQPAKAS